MPTTRRRPVRASIVTVTAALLTGLASTAIAQPVLAQDVSGQADSSPAVSTPVAPAHGSSRIDCPPSGRALGFSDGLDKLTAQGAEVGGLSALTYDKRRSAYAAIEDHSGSDATRMWFFRDPKHPTVTGTLLLAKSDGTPYTGDDFDAEGLAILPNGDYVVSSEVEPSIHVFSRKGKEKSTLPVPARFEVAPAGEATSNATLEGLSVSHDGRQIYAAMEGTLSGDISASGDATSRRILVYTRHSGGAYALSKQIGYRVGDGMRISEVSTYGRNGLLVLEAAFDPAIGNTIRLVAVPNARHATDVSKVADLGDKPAKVAKSTLVADVTKCPDLGATSKETQANPLMDNYEAMAVSTSTRRDRRDHHRHGSHAEHGNRHIGARVLLLSDDNFGDGQTTRLLRLSVELPR